MIRLHAVDIPIEVPVAAGGEPAFLTRIRLRARRLVLWLRMRWSGDLSEGRSFSISDGEVDRILFDRNELARIQTRFFETDPEAVALAAEIRSADLVTMEDDRLAAFRAAFCLSEWEVDLLTLTVAVEADPGLRRAFGYIHDDATCSLPTRWLAQQLFAWPPGATVGVDGGLMRWRLACPLDYQGNGWSVVAPWAADPHVVSCLLHGFSPDPHLGDAHRIVSPSDIDPGACLYPAELEEAASFVRTLQRKNAQAIEVALLGPTGAGKRTLAAQLCARLRIPLVVADANRIMGPDVSANAAIDAVLRVTRTARMLGAAVYWHDVEGVTTATWREARGRCPLSIVGTLASARTPHVPDDGAVRRVVRLPSLTRVQRAAFWSKISALSVPTQVLDWPLLPADIARAAAVAPAGSTAVTDACRPTLPPGAASLAALLPRPYVWEDLVVPPSTKRHLVEFETQARLRWTVYEDWGFGKSCSMGRGISALFAGPSGTGKTMAAQVLARSLGMEIYRVDLAGVMSKYIGETEKHLREVFDASERANVLLFFDEADALFGQRTQIKDAHDRYANVAVDYLLQRMEHLDGIVVLATNRRHDIDSGFMRRVRFVIDFLPPGVAERRELWTRALPSHSPSGETILDGINWDLLAERLDLTGADIKAAAMAAAFLARHLGEPIGMKHVLHAARRELAKRGKVLRLGAEVLPE